MLITINTITRFIKDFVFMHFFVLLTTVKKKQLEKIQEMSAKVNESLGSCTLFNGDDSKCNTLIVLKRVTGTFSLLGCIFMIFVIWLFKKYRVQSQRLIMFLSVAALFDAIGYMAGDITPDGPACDFEAWILTYFDWCVLMWVSCITYNLYMNVVRMRNVASQEKYFHIASWLCPPLLLSVLPFIGDNYGPAGAWCWIKHESTVWRFVIWYIPLFIAIIMLFLAYSYITWQIKRQNVMWQGNMDADTQANQENLLEDIKLLKGYPFVYLGLSIFPLILRIHNAFTAEGDDVFALWVLTVLTAPLQGACNAVVFGMDPDTRARLTWTQIRLTLSNRFQDNSGLQEYPVDVAAAPYQKYENDE